MLRLCLCLAAALATLAQAQSPAEFFRETFEEMLRHDPEFATSIGRHEYDDRWTDWSKAGRDRRRVHLLRSLERVKALAGLSGQDRLTAELLAYDFRSSLDVENLETHLLRVGQLVGLHNTVYEVIDRMPAHTARDYRNILARLDASPVYVDQNLALLDESIASGLMQPRIVADLVTRQLAAQMTQEPDSSELLAAFRKFPSQIPASEQAALRKQAQESYRNRFQPAWRKLHDYIAGRYMKNVRSRDGADSLPAGRQAYAALVRRFTTTSMGPEEIHRLGEREVTRIEGEMRGLLKEAGFNGSIAEYERSLEAAPGQRFRTREEMLAYCRNIAKIIEPELPKQFRHIPMLLYGIRAIPPDREAAMASNALQPAPDYSAPGWFNLNTYRPGQQVRYDKEALVLHEAVPGHIFQLTLAQALEGLPDIRKFYFNSAYGEGWALYAESLGSQLGVYKEPAARFGQLASERFRAVRLVVDTGIHALGWTRERAIEYFRAHAPESSLAEVDRYISWPGQALSYKLGQLRIRELRARAEQRLGERFDVREFHDAVLRNGILPLDLLTAQVEEYIGR